MVGIVMNTRINAHGYSVSDVKYHNRETRKEMTMQITTSGYLVINEGVALCLTRNLVITTICRPMAILDIEMNG
jgi:hypothetical protein